MSARSMLTVACCVAVLSAAAPASTPDGPDQSAQEMMRLALRGVYFVENQGQWSDDSVHYGLKSRGLDIAFRESSFTMHLARESGSTSRAREEAVLGVEGDKPPFDSHSSSSLVSDYGAQLVGDNAPRNIARDTPLPHARGSSGDLAEYEHLTLTITFPGSHPVAPRGGKPQAAKFNYFVGGEGRGTATNVPSFGAVIYENLYNGVDLHVMGNDDGVMKYEFHCQPGADYTQIRIEYDGIDSLRVNDAGDLEIETVFGTLRDSAPLVWQGDIASTSRADSTSRAREEAVFNIVRDAPLPDSRGSSDPTIPARFETLDGRTYTITLDETPDPSRPLVIDPEIQWMYYLGGSGDEVGRGIVVDGAGNALVTGGTGSTDFAGRNNSYYDNENAFALKVSPSGELQWMTYLGGRTRDVGQGIAVDSADNALVTGYTDSTNFAGRNNSFYGDTDAFALKVSPSGQLLWMTYLGGNGWDGGQGIAVDSAGNALVTGVTALGGFEGRNNSYYGGSNDAFALKVSPSGQLEWMTYLGGRGEEWGNSIAVDSADNALVTGDTWSTDFEGRNNSYHSGDGDVFVLKVSPSGELQWMTFLGGSGSEEGLGIAVDSADNALVTGQTSSTDFHGRNNAFHGGGTDAFALKVGPSGQLLWMTYIGGSDLDSGFGMVLDSAGSALVTGQTSSTDFEGRNNSFHGGNDDAFLVKLRLAPDRPILTVAATCPSGGPIQIEWFGATPDGDFLLIFARNTGSVTVPNNRPCAGTQLGLGARQIQVVWQGRSDSDGSRVINTIASSAACGGYLQLLDLTPCATSNVARIE